MTTRRNVSVKVGIKAGKKMSTENSTFTCTDNSSERQKCCWWCLFCCCCCCSCFCPFHVKLFVAIGTFSVIYTRSRVFGREKLNFEKCSITRFRWCRKNWRSSQHDVHDFTIDTEPRHQKNHRSVLMYQFVHCSLIGDQSMQWILKHTHTHRISFSHSALYHDLFANNLLVGKWYWPRIWNPFFAQPFLSIDYCTTN